MNKILITGSSGFIGTALSKYLKSFGYSIVDFPREKGGIINKEIWDSLEKTDCVIHLAARNFVPDSWMESSNFLESNVIGTSRMLEYAKKNRAKAIFISAYLYGNPSTLPIQELHPLNPNNPYALSKSLAEAVCKFHAEFLDQDVTILRLFNVYGPGQRVNFLIPTLIKQCFEGKEIKVLDLVPKRDYVFIDDVLEAIRLSMIQSGKFQLYNIGSGNSFSVAEIIDIIQKICETNLPVRSSEIARKNEIMNVVADISKAKEKLGWSPRFNIINGLEKTISGMR